jgi:hypothetical protein
MCVVGWYVVEGKRKVGDEEGCCKWEVVDQEKTEEGRGVSK